MRQKSFSYKTIHPLSYVSNNKSIHIKSRLCIHRLNLLYLLLIFLHFGVIRQLVVFGSALFCICLSWPLSAASPKPDSAATSLLRQLGTQKADTSHLRILTALCYRLHDTEPTRALQYGEQAVRLATQTSNQPGQLRALLVLASCYANLADGAQALKLQQQALPLAQRLHDTDGVVRAYTGMGSIHHERNDTTNALRSYNQALTLAYNPGVRVRTQLMLFGNLGNLYSYLGNFPQALLYTRRALQLARNSHDKVGESRYMANLGLCYYQQDRLDIAEGLIRQAITLVEPLRSYRIEASHLELLATILLLKNELQDAEELTRRALLISRQIQYRERVLDAYNLLAEINSSRQNYQQAFEWQSLFRDLNDSLNNSSRLQTLTALQVRYETAEKESQIRQLTQRGQTQRHRNRELWAIVGALVVGLSGVGFLYWKLRRSQAALAANHAALHEATNELRELAASKDRLYTIVAHDLRGPVTSFVGVTELIDFYMKRGDQKGLQRLPALVRQSAQSLNGLLDNLLNWAVSQNGELVSQPERLTVDELFTEIEELYRTTAEAKQIQLTATVPLYLTVWADRNMTRTILRNLVGNALKFTPGGGLVQLDATPSMAGNTLTLSVRDTGHGMTQEQVDALLTSNSKAPSASLPGNAGLSTGLGFPLCRAFTERLGGKLAIQSSLGSGTIVRVELPG